MPDGTAPTVKATEERKNGTCGFGDTSLGIPEENKIFKTLFTTKFRGKGFGIAVCKRLVEAHSSGL